MMSRQIRRVLRRGRAYWRRWSPARDQAYHDWLFGNQQIDPFQPSYPGYITIRRFADFASTHVQPATRVLDLGCGPGEITCELARRHPDTQFEGIDHSRSGIARAQGFCERLGLANATFRVADVEQFEPDGRVDLVVMFDSFHHLSDPAAFVPRMGRFSSRFFLIDPRGDWAGRWTKEIDLDWLVHDLDRSRARLTHATGEPDLAPGPGSPSTPEVEEPVEHRYPPEDFEEWFAGYGLETRGTVAGLDTYPPSPESVTPTRARFGELAYELYKEADEMLRARDLDLLAKQLVIYAECGVQTERRAPPDEVPGRLRADRIRGPYDARYLAYDGPREAKAGESLHATVRLRNESWRALSSAVEKGPDFVSYHWLSRRGSTVHHDGVRTPLPRIVQPGDTVDVSVRIQAPEHRGRLTLAVDMVRESTTWFSDAGSPCLRIPFRVR